MTQIQPFERFWPAEADMQDFYNKNAYAPYCQVVIDPKIAKLRKEFAARFKEA